MKTGQTPTGLTRIMHLMATLGPIRDLGVNLCPARKARREPGSAALGGKYRREALAVTVAQLGLLIILDADPFDQLKLGFQEIDVLFFIFQNAFENLT